MINVTELQRAVMWFYSLGIILELSLYIQPSLLGCFYVVVIW